VGIPRGVETLLQQRQARWQAEIFAATLTHEPSQPLSSIRRNAEAADRLLASDFPSRVDPDARARSPARRSPRRHPRQRVPRNVVSGLSPTTIGHRA